MSKIRAKTFHNYLNFNKPPKMFKNRQKCPKSVKKHSGMSKNFKIKSKKSKNHHTCQKTRRKTAQNYVKLSTNR